MSENGGFKARIQQLGSALSSMVMPNIGAFIAWGLITALFIPTGWLPNEKLALLVGPMQLYLLPILIGYTGGSTVYQQRGAVVGAIATAGAIIGALPEATGLDSAVPMFIGAMIMGPLGGWAIKKFDERYQDKIRQGFEMLVNNFSAGIIGFILAIIGFYAVGPFVLSLTAILAGGVEWIIDYGLLPLTNIFIEPAKVLFLNNAINHGILTPLGSQQAEATGKSILYLLEANPGPGLGVLLAYMVYGRGSAKASASGAAIIHFLGGIHEIYFPYVMMNPLMFGAVIAGGVVGTFVLRLLNVGLSGPASPGSIIAILGMTARGDHLGMLLGVTAAAAVSFAVAAVILRMDKSTDEEDDFEATQQAVQASKSQSKGQVEAESDDVPMANDINRIIFACDAGMGSSAMGASLLRRKAKEHDVSLPVTNSAINNLEDASDVLIITQNELTNRARQHAPSATHISVDNFLNEKQYDDILSQMKGEAEVDEDVSETSSSVLPIDQVERIVVAYDGQVGSSTMAASQLRNAARKLEVKIPIEAVDLNEANFNDQTLVIVTPELASKVHVKGTLVWRDLLEESQYESLFDALK